MLSFAKSNFTIKGIMTYYTTYISYKSTMITDFILLTLYRSMLRALNSEFSLTEEKQTNKELDFVQSKKIRLRYG